MVQMQDVWAREARALSEFAELMSDRIYWSPPREGAGRAVLVLPGLFGNDIYLTPLRLWLGRSGYQAVGSALLVNAGCPERLSRRIEEHLASRLRTDDARLAIIGHSRGGLLGRTIAARLQDRVSHLVLLGSPVGGMTSWARAAGFTAGAPAAAQVRQAGDQARRLLDPDCNVPECGCPFPSDFLQPLSRDTRVVSIFSPDDPIVPAMACHVRGGTNVEVSGSHSGLAFNRSVYRALVDALRE